MQGHAKRCGRALCSLGRDGTGTVLEACSVTKEGSFAPGGKSEVWGHWSLSCPGTWLGDLRLVGVTETTVTAACCSVYDVSCVSYRVTVRQHKSSWANFMDCSS
ncbi:hypothetical protein BaRGS_00025915 [Batillaria attramentaria]|uniref:Uncharacterized protein n=1 Tax=Batillaria attramentaria TaxID=370345 RepID=A0ABD0K7I3_9CAEN